MNALNLIQVMQELIKIKVKNFNILAEILID